MRSTTLFSLVVAFFALTSFSPLTPSSGEFVKFTLKNAGITVEGSFSKFSTDVSYVAGNPSSSRFRGEIHVASISTGIEMRDEHLRGEDYFNVAKFPVILFTSGKVITRTDGLLEVAGTLTMKGVSKPIVIKVKPIIVNDQTYLEGSVVLDRRDYGVGGNSWVMGDDITCTIRAKAN